MGASRTGPATAIPPGAWRRICTDFPSQPQQQRGVEEKAMSDEEFVARGGCRCNDNPVRYEYTARPVETHYCCCTDCTDVSGGALAILAVVDRNAFRVTQGQEKIKVFDTKPTAHRSFCGTCGAHMFLHVDPFPDFVLVHVPTLDREYSAGTRPDRWVFVESRHELLTLPEDGLPKHTGWVAAG
jgi:S-(hydroxymethyl)glutathione synthase